MQEMKYDNLIKRNTEGAIECPMPGDRIPWNKGVQRDCSSPRPRETTQQLKALLTGWLPAHTCLTTVCNSSILIIF